MIKNEELPPDDIIGEVGGLVDESRVTLVVYCADSNPAEVSDLLAVAPSRSHRQGDRAGPRSPPFKTGAWFLEQHGQAPVGPDKLLRRLLAQLPDPSAPVWAQLHERFEPHLLFGLFSSQWNRGFTISSECAAKLGLLGLRLEFDIYADTDET